MKGTIRLTTFSKVLILLIILGLIGAGIYAGVTNGIIKNKEKETDLVINETVEQSKTNSSEPVTTGDNETNVINLSIDEWVG